MPVDGELEIWNGAVSARPAAVRRCADAAAVSEAVRRARADGLPLSVLGGGHDWAGRAVRDGGLVIDLRDLNTVDIDPVRRVATAGGGALSRDVVAAAAAHRLLPAAGTARRGGV